MAYTSRAWRMLSATKMCHRRIVSGSPLWSSTTRRRLRSANSGSLSNSTRAAA